jgi:hypothetical protein
MTVDSYGYAIVIGCLRDKSLWMKPRVGILKISKPEFPKKTTTVRFGWTRGSDQWSSGETTLDETESRNLETPEARISEENYHR